MKDLPHDAKTILQRLESAKEAIECVYDELVDSVEGTLSTAENKIAAAMTEIDLAEKAAKGTLQSLVAIHAKANRGSRKVYLHDRHEVIKVRLWGECVPRCQGGWGKGGGGPPRILEPPHPLRAQLITHNKSKYQRK